MIIHYLKKYDNTLFELHVFGNYDNTQFEGYDDTLFEGYLNTLTKGHDNRTLEGRKLQHYNSMIYSF